MPHGLPQGALQPGQHSPSKVPGRKWGDGVWGSGDPSIRVFRRGHKSSPLSSPLQTPTTSTSSRRTPASWAWWCAGAPPWCSSARRTAWRPSPTPSSSSRRPSRRGRRGQAALGLTVALGETGLSSFCIGHIFVFLIKLQTSHVGSPRTLLSASVFWVAGIRFSPAELSSTSPGPCWGLGGGDRALGQPPATSAAPSLLRFVPSVPPCGLAENKANGPGSQPSLSPSRPGTFPTPHS